MNNYTSVVHHVGGHADTLADLIDRIDLNDLVTADAGQGRQGPGRIVYRCPNAGVHAHGDRTPSFTVTDAGRGRQRWKCWGACQTGGDALDYVQWRHGLDRTDAIRWLRQYTGTTLTPAPSRPTPKPPTGTARATVARRTPPAPTGERRTDATAVEIFGRYCAWRGWPIEVAERYGLHVIGDAGRIYCRHPFYVPTATGPMMFGWQDRALFRDARAKWKAPAGWPLPLWGTPSLQTSTVPAVVICEGPADGLTASYVLDGYGPIGVVAVPGVATWRPEWTPLFAGLHVVTAADPDTAGDGLAARLTADLTDVAATVTPAYRPMLDTDLTDALRTHGPDYVAAALMEPLHTLGVI